MVSRNSRAKPKRIQFKKNREFATQWADYTSSYRMQANPYIEQNFLEVERLIHEEQFSVSRKLLEDMLSEEPAYALAHSRLGWLYHNCFKQFEQAKRHYELAIKFDPKHPDAHLNLMQILLDLGEFKELINAFNEGLKSNGFQKDKALEIIGFSAEKQLKFKQAEKYYRSSVDHSFDNHLIAKNEQHLNRLSKKRKLGSRRWQFWK